MSDTKTLLQVLQKTTLPTYQIEMADGRGATATIFELIQLLIGEGATLDIVGLKSILDWVAIAGPTSTITLGYEDGDIMITRIQ